MPPPAHARRTLSDGIACELAPSGPERDPHGQLAPPGHRTRELEVGHVRAGDEEHEQDGAGQHQERLPVAHHLIEQRNHAEGEAAVGRINLREVAAQPRGDHIELGLGGLDGDAGTKPREQVVILRGADRGCGGRQRQRQEDLAVFHHAQRRQHLPGQGKVRRQHADDLVRFAVQHERRADDRRIGAEPPLPCSMRQHDRSGAARRVVLGHEQSAERGAGAEHRQQIDRHAQGAEPLRLAAAGQGGVGADGNGHVGERALAVSNVEVLRRGEPVLGDAEPGDRFHNTTSRSGSA